MNWKELPTWLKGAIIFVFLDILNILFILLPNRPFVAYVDTIVFSLFFTHIPLSWVYLSLFGMHVDTLVSMVPFLIVGLINWFLVGALIGWIVRKIRSKK